jgi:phosphonate transport system substrate-binding protein
MASFARALSERTGMEVVISALDSYNTVAQRLHHGDIDLAWLAPVPFIALLNCDAIVPLASTRAAPYRSAIIVRATSKLSDPKRLRGWRGAWVDPHSASGFIVPRLELARLGVSFGCERFFGTHDAVVGAIADGEADFGGTYAWIDAHGNINGPWSSTELQHKIRVLTTFGDIPSDVLVARSTLAKPMRKAIVSALKSMTGGFDPTFGAIDFCRPTLDSYERLRVQTLEAHRQGMLSVDSSDPLDVAQTLEIRVPIELDDVDLIEEAPLKKYVH